MVDETKVETGDPVKKTRRQFVTSASQVAITAPAVALLMSAGSKSAMAQSAYADTATAGDAVPADDLVDFGAVANSDPGLPGDGTDLNLGDDRAVDAGNIGPPRK